MKFLHYEVSAQQGDIIHVTLRGTEANVRVMDDINFHAFQSGRQHRYAGGHFKSSPVNIPAPSSGKLNVVVDLGGYAGRLEASVRVISRVA